MAQAARLAREEASTKLMSGPENNSFEAGWSTQSLLGDEVGCQGVAEGSMEKEQLLPKKMYDGDQRERCGRQERF